MHNPYLKDDVQSMVKWFADDSVTTNANRFKVSK